jgi:hypothetical protein
MEIKLGKMEKSNDYWENKLKDELAHYNKEIGTKNHEIAALKEELSVVKIRMDQEGIEIIDNKDRQISILMEKLRDLEDRKKVEFELQAGDTLQKETLIERTDKENQLLKTCIEKKNQEGFHLLGKITDLEDQNAKLQEDLDDLSNLPQNPLEDTKNDELIIALTQKNSELEKELTQRPKTTERGSEVNPQVSPEDLMRQLLQKTNRITELEEKLSSQPPVFRNVNEVDLQKLESIIVELNEELTTTTKNWDSDRRANQVDSNARQDEIIDLE